MTQEEKRNKVMEIVEKFGDDYYGIIEYSATGDAGEMDKLVQDTVNKIFATIEVK
jgi:hypothetical protein